MHTLIHNPRTPMRTTIHTHMHTPIHTHEHPQAHTHAHSYTLTRAHLLLDLCTPPPPPGQTQCCLSGESVVCVAVNVQLDADSSQECTHPSTSLRARFLYPQRSAHATAVRLQARLVWEGRRTQIGGSDEKKTCAYDTVLRARVHEE